MDVNFYQNNRVRELINAEIFRRQQVGENPEEWCKPGHKFAPSGRRRYIGASQIGGECVRAPWYDFHWALPPAPFDPRVLRLFDRGHREEERMVGYLKLIGMQVQEYDPATVPSLWYHPESDSYVVVLGDDVSESLASQCDDVTGTYHEWIARSRGVDIPDPKQFNFSDFDEHHGGNCDGRALAGTIPDYERWGLSPDEWALLEFKTSNEKNFIDLCKNGLKNGKPDHYSQIQRYMDKMKMRLAVYGSVCKNNDELFFEYVPINPDWHYKLDKVTYEAIYSAKPPPRLSNSPSWFGCRWCGARPQCHYGAPQQKNCRSCSSSMPITGGNWQCNRWMKAIPREDEGTEFACWTQRHD